jgi:hypothetical protein
VFDRGTRVAVDLLYVCEGSFSTFLQRHQASSSPIANQRNLNELLSLAAIGDSLLRRGLPATDESIELLARRFVGVFCAEVKGTWAYADVLGGAILQPVSLTLMDSLNKIVGQLGSRDWTSNAGRKGEYGSSASQAVKKAKKKPAGTSVASSAHSGTTGSSLPATRAGTGVVRESAAIGRAGSQGP